MGFKTKRKQVSSDFFLNTYGARKNHHLFNFMLLGTYTSSAATGQVLCLLVWYISDDVQMYMS